MRDVGSGLYQDGFHITGWRRLPNGTEHPGTGDCDELNSMVYTYNQGVLLTANRGLWVSTGLRTYLDDGHKLVGDVIRATGWPNHDRIWHGLGRGGVLEEFCDHGVYCNQDGQTFKGIFFHHLTEFCRPLWPHEEAFMDANTAGGFNKDVHQYHQSKCAAYGAWVAHNAQAASMTADEDGRFGMWWGRKYPDATPIGSAAQGMVLPHGAVDYVHNGLPDAWSLSTKGHDRPRPKQAGGPLFARNPPKDINDHGR